MLARPQFVGLTVLGCLALVLVLINGTMALGNRSRQTDITARQAGVQQAAQLQVLQTEIAKALAELAIKSNDKQVFDMLAANGITVTLNQPAKGGDKTPASNPVKR